MPTKCKDASDYLCWPGVSDQLYYASYHYPGIHQNSLLLVYLGCGQFDCYLFSLWINYFSLLVSPNNPPPAGILSCHPIFWERARSITCLWWMAKMMGCHSWDQISKPVTLLFWTVSLLPSQIAHFDDAASSAGPHNREWKAAFCQPPARNWGL